MKGLAKVTERYNLEPKDKVLLESIKDVVFKTKSKGGMNQYMGAKV